MLEQVLMGNKEDLLKFFKRMFIVMVTLAVISIILINTLFVYYEHYVYKEDARVIYNIQHTSSHT
ncbi:MAG: hypothetical protein U0L26_05405 [Cellulosilyticum sp.]|nr:hypothetical protein [Cellulosilyticum sp.]MEE1071817.1 hypothetical protein [Cellulosilyticum sp.]